MPQLYVKKKSLYSHTYTLTRNAILVFYKHNKTNNKKGGCGGCQFAPGSKGNISTEKLVRVSKANRVQSSIDENTLKKVNVKLSGLLQRELEN